MTANSALEIVPASQSEYEESEVNITCVESSEFVLGKQINFNCPVTLISCVNSQEENPEIKKEQKDEKIIIRDKVSAPTTGDNEKKNEGAPKKLQERMLKKLKNVPKVPVFLSCGLVVAAAITLAVFLVVTSTVATGEPESTIIGSHVFYPKKAWGGAPPKSTVEMKLPIPYAVVSHTVTTQCFQFKSCKLLIKTMQNYHMSIEYADIAYNFLVDSSGNIYEGRGWNIRNVKGGFVNGRNIDIALIGDYSEAAFPTDGIMDGLKDLLKFGVESGVLSKNYSLLASNSTYSTLSPGINVYVIIKDWPHFDPDPKSHVKEYEV